MKIYVDTTGELVIDDGGIERRYPAFSELSRFKVNSDQLRIEAVGTYKKILQETLYSDLQDSGGTPYASFAALKTALDGYFDDTV